MKKELIERFKDEHPEYKYIHWRAEVFVNWLIDTVIAELQKENEILRTTKLWDKEYHAEVDRVVEREIKSLQEKYDKLTKRKDETIQSQADKITELVKHVESGDECHKGVTARKCHCEPIQEKYDKLKQRVGSAPKIKEGSAEECMLMSEDTLAKDWGEKSPKAMIADLSEDELQRLTMAIHGKINTIIPARINGMTIREVMNALVELTPEEMDGNQTP